MSHKRHTDIYPRAASWLRIGGELAAYQTNSLPHTGKPEAILAESCDWIKSLSIVPDRETYGIFYMPQFHVGMTSTAVFNDIPQGFLCDPVEAYGSLLGNACRQVVVREFDIYTVGLSELCAKTPDCRDQAQLLKLHGVQLVREIVDGRRELLDLL
jgi:hypothetical protein